MKVRSPDTRIRTILTGMLTDTDFLDECEGFLKPELFDSPGARRLGRWALAHYQTYREAIGMAVLDRFENFVSSREEDDSEVVQMAGILERLEEGGTSSVEYMKDAAWEFFQFQQFRVTAGNVMTAVDNGDLEAAMQAVQGYDELEKERPSWVDPFLEPDRAAMSVEKTGEELFRIHGALGCLVNPMLKREHLVSILASEKKGKTFHLTNLALAARAQGRDVAFFQAGDMTEDQLLTRIGVTLTGRPEMESDCGEFEVPCLDCQYNIDDECDMEWRKCDVDSTRAGYLPCRVCQRLRHPDWSPVVTRRKVREDRPLTVPAARKALDHFRRITPHSQFRLSTHPNETLTTYGIYRILDRWERLDGFVPDVIVIDYADLLEVEGMANKDRRNQEDTKWKRLRRMSQERRALVITASQADTASYEAKVLGATNFSESKTKNAHVNAIFGLNQSPEEKEAGIMRVNTVLARGMDFNSHITARVLYSLRIGRPHISSFF
jgi:hypothetical protein